MKMRKYVLTAVLSAAALTPGVSSAQSTSGTFNVNITLTSACTLSAITALDFAYTSNQAGVQAATGGGLTVNCTNTLPYTFGLQAGSGAAVPPGAASISPPADNVVNLLYTLTAPAGATGNGTPQGTSITGSMAALQAGTCGVASCTNAAATNRTHTLIVNF